MRMLSYKEGPRGTRLSTRPPARALDRSPRPPDIAPDAAKAATATALASVPAIVLAVGAAKRRP